MELKRIRIRGLSKVLSEKELRNVIGGGYAGYSECCHCSYIIIFADGFTLSGDGVFCGNQGCTGHNCCWDAAEEWMYKQAYPAFGAITSKSWACNPDF